MKPVALFGTNFILSLTGSLFITLIIPSGQEATTLLLQVIYSFKDNKSTLY